jgi:maltose O-acetyltransferase
MAIMKLGHINIVVDNIEEASKYYCNLLKGKAVQRFNNFKNEGFSKSAGFMEDYDKVDVSIEFIEIDQSGIFIELMQYHYPNENINHINRDKKTHQIGGVGHVCLKVEGIMDEFNRIKNTEEVRFISTHEDYQPFQISPIKADDFYFLDQELEMNSEVKQEVVDVVGGIRYFYFIDKYGIQWEFEEGHTDIG